MAEFFGLTKEAIRYYERKGVVTSIRDERTGYRYYERDEITTLKQIRTYESLGFSLDDAQAMVGATTFSEMEERLVQKLLELKRKKRPSRACGRSLNASSAISTVSNRAGWNCG